MVGISEKFIRVVAFSGKSKDYRMWAARFMAGAHVKRYQQCLVEDFSEREIVRRKMLAEPKKEEETTAQAKARIEKDVKEGITEEDVDMVVRAYADLMLACSEELSFGIVFNAKSTIFPDGDAYLAWQRLKRKYEPSTNAQKIMLQREFHQSHLTGITKNPDDWIEELEILRARLETLEVIISDEDLILQVLEGLPKDYDMIVTLLNARYKVDDLDVSTLREELMMHHERLNRYKKNNKRKDDGDFDENHEETALTAAFKGCCRGCGEYGHKKSDCPKENVGAGGESGKFTGSCFFCKKKGHIKKDCRAWKRKQSEKANVVSDAAIQDEVSLIVFESNPVRDLVIRSFPNASEDEIINWETAVEDEIVILEAMGTWEEIDNIDADLVMTYLSDTVDCCCEWSNNFYNVLCCGNRDDDDSSSSTDGRVDQEENSPDVEPDDGSAEGSSVNMGAFELWSSAIEESFHQLAMGDDDYSVHESSDDEG